MTRAQEPTYGDMASATALLGAWRNLTGLQPAMELYALWAGLPGRVLARLSGDLRPPAG